MFDPSEFTVKEASALLCELDISELEAVLAAEIDGKHRSSLVAEIGRSIDEIKTSEEVEVEIEDEAEAPAPPEEPVLGPVVVVRPEVEEVSLSQADWYKLPRHMKKRLVVRGDGRYVEKK